jgi:hypothetical protein
MANITTREVGDTAKGNPLTTAELDNNFINLNSDIASRIPSTEKGVANGVATLDASGLIPTTQLPSYVDDVLEADNLASFPATGETGKIYVALDTNKTYRWSGSAYVFITSGAVDSVAGKTGVVTLNSSDVGLGNVNNTSDADKPVSSATQTALNTKQNTLVSGTTIKTVNGTSVLGEGNIQIDGGVTSFNTRTGAVSLTSADVTNALEFSPVNKAGDTITGDLLNSAAYSAPSNSEGAGTTLKIRGSTGTGIAGTTGGNGQVEILGGGATSVWETPSNSTRGGVLVQSGTAQADANNTYVAGSTLELRAGSGTTNGTQVGFGGRTLIAAGGTTRADGNTSGAASVIFWGGRATQSGYFNLASGTLNFGDNFERSSGGLIDSYPGTPTEGGELNLRSGFYSSGAAQSFTSNTGGNIVLTGATATTGGDILLYPGTASSTVAGGVNGQVKIDDYIVLHAGNYSSYAQPLLVSGTNIKTVNGTSVLGSGDIVISAGPGTNIEQGTRTTTAVPINSSTGTGATLSAATTSLAGVMTSADKTKLDGIDNSANNYSLPKATATIRGGVELGSDTVQTIAANAVTAIASRSYAVQLNSADQMVVNVPWVDTNTNTVTRLRGTTAGTYTSGDLTLLAGSNVTITQSGSDYTIAATQPSVGDGTLSVAAKTAGATNTDVTLELSGAYSANTSNNRTIKAVVGPALTALATLMNTAGAGFIRRGATANTYTVDTSTYLTSEADTLATVTGRGATTSTPIDIRSAQATGTTAFGTRTWNQVPPQLYLQSSTQAIGAGGSIGFGSKDSATTDYLNWRIRSVFGAQGGGFGANMGLLFDAGTDGGGTTALTNVLTLLGNGNVGIGTTEPEARLHVTPSVGGYGSIVAASLAGQGVGAKIENTSAAANSYAIHTVQTPYASVALVASNGTNPTGTINTSIEVGNADFYIRGGQTNKDIYIATNYNQNAVKVSGVDKSMRLYSVVASTSTTTGALVVDGGVGIAGALNATTKSFIIDHPTRSGMQLRYGSLEGPEFGVYIRGKLKGKNKIELPEYWTKLVDPDSITVTLTPIGKHQKLYVEDIADNVVTVANDGLFAGEINCFFVVYGERVDVDKLVVESE